MQASQLLTKVQYSGKPSRIGGHYFYADFDF